jgi:hypothetical protein
MNYDIRRGTTQHGPTYHHTSQLETIFQMVLVVCLVEGFQQLHGMRCAEPPCQTELHLERTNPSGYDLQCPKQRAGNMSPRQRVLQNEMDLMWSSVPPRCSAVSALRSYKAGSLPTSPQQVAPRNGCRPTARQCELTVQEALRPRAVNRPWVLARGFQALPMEVGSSTTW